MIEIEVTGSETSRLYLPFLLDTGFAGYLTLPPEVIRHLDLIPAGRATGELANGAQFEFNSYFATVSWHGRPPTGSGSGSQRRPAARHIPAVGQPGYPGNASRRRSNY